MLRVRNGSLQKLSVCVLSPINMPKRVLADLSDHLSRFRGADTTRTDRVRDFLWSLQSVYGRKSMALVDWRPGPMLTACVIPSNNPRSFNRPRESTTTYRVRTVTCNVTELKTSVQRSSAPEHQSTRAGNRSNDRERTGCTNAVRCSGFRVALKGNG